MIVCENCAKANQLTDTAHPGLFECESCGACGQNAAYVVESLTEMQRARAKRSFAARINELVGILLSGKGYDPDPRGRGES